MYRTILVPLDGSALAERALTVARPLVTGAESRLILIRAVPLHTVPNTEAQAYLAAVASRLDVPVPVDRVLYYGDAPEGILEEANRRRADLIVMATHGRSGLGRWLYGSVADEVLRRVPIPVLLVPATCDRIWDGTRPLRLLVPLDGSRFSLTALGAARALCQLAGPAGAEIALLQVIEPPSAALFSTSLGEILLDDDALLAEARQYLDRIANTLAPSARAVTAHVVVGSPAVEIAALARIWPADLIVMATHGRGGLTRLVMGSTATGTLHRAHTPLLLVRPTSVQLAAVAESGLPATQARGEGQRVAGTA